MITPHIVCTFPDLMRSASARWRTPIFQSHVAEALELDKMTINRWMHGVTRYDLAIIGRICAYFGCEVGELLVLCGPDTKISDIAHRAVRRRTAPEAGVPSLICKSHIGTRLKDVPSDTPIKISRSGLVNLRKDGFHKIDQPTLEELCRVLDVTSINDLLWVDVALLGEAIDLGRV